MMVVRIYNWCEYWIFVRKYIPYLFMWQAMSCQTIQVLCRLRTFIGSWQKNTEKFTVSYPVATRTRKLISIPLETCLWLTHHLLTARINLTRAAIFGKFVDIDYIRTTFLSSGGSTHFKLPETEIMTGKTSYMTFVCRQLLFGQLWNHRLRIQCTRAANP